MVCSTVIYRDRQTGRQRRWIDLIHADKLADERALTRGLLWTRPSSTLTGRILVRHE